MCNVMNSTTTTTTRQQHVIAKYIDTVQLYIIERAYSEVRFFGQFPTFFPTFPPFLLFYPFGVMKVRTMPPRPQNARITSILLYRNLYHLSNFRNLILLSFNYFLFSLLPLFNFFLIFLVLSLQLPNRQIEKKNY